MKKMLLTLHSLLCTALLIAQPCTQQNLATMPGKWKASKFSQADVDPAAPAKIGPVLRLVNQTLQKGYRWPLQGGDITTHDVATNSTYAFEPFYLRKKVVPGLMTWYFQDYLCRKGLVDINEASSEFDVRYNQFPFRFSESFFRAPISDPATEDMQTNTYTYSLALPRFENGIWDIYFGGRNGMNVLTNDTTALESLESVIRVIAKPGIAPIIPMSKAEYYDNNVQILRHSIDENQKLINDVKASKEIDIDTKKRMIDMYEGQKKVASDNIENINATKAAHNKEELAKPAIFHEESGSYIDTEPDIEKGEQYVLKPNPAYFNFRLSSTDLQLCSIIFNVRGQSRGKEVNDPRFVADQQFVNHLFEMDAIGLATKVMQPLIKN